MKYLKKIGIYIFFISVIILFNQQDAFASLKLEINDKVISSNPLPEMKGNRVYVPLKVISENLGYQVEWDDVNKVVQIYTDDYQQTEKVYQSDSGIGIMINGERTTFSSNLGVAYIKNPGYTMVPLRAVAEILGAKVDWRDNSVYITHDIQQNKIVEVVKTQADLLSIKGNSQVSIEQVNRYLSQQEARIKKDAEVKGYEFIPFPENIGKMYLDIGAQYQIRGDVALCQALHETGFFQYRNEVKAEQNNFCGLGAIGRVTTEEDLVKLQFSKIDPNDAHLEIDKHGWYFRTVPIGVEAHIQHIYSYSTRDALPNGKKLVDGRFNHKHRGTAEVWSDLNGRWAVPGNGYAQKIVDVYWTAMMNHK